MYFHTRLTFIITIFLLAGNAQAFTYMPVGSFDSVGYFSFFNSTANRNANADTDIMDEDVPKAVDRETKHTYLSFSPTEKFSLFGNYYQTNLNPDDAFYAQKSGPSNDLKTEYIRSSIGTRVLFFNRDGSPVKIGIYNSLIVNNTADQDGEAFGFTPFFYIGHKLPISLRYAYNVEASRRKTRTVDADFSTIDQHYDSHLYFRFEPYHSVARFPVGYEYYQRNGTAPDKENFDVKKDKTIEHSIFFNLPANLLLTFKIQDQDNRREISFGLEVPFF